jgi:PhnB protein
MAIKSLNPYLSFDGTAEKAIELYESALGAKTEGPMRWGDVPDMKVAAEHRNRVMHALLHIGEGDLMLADSQPDRPAAKDTNVQVCLHFDDVADMAKKFAALGAGGQVTMPLQDTFWGARFGMLTDAYGIHWMFNCELKKD